MGFFRFLVCLLALIVVVLGGLELIPLNMSPIHPNFNGIQTLKASHHHLPGYFQSYDLPLYLGLPPSRILHMYSDIKVSLSLDSLVNWSYDGYDFIASPQRYLEHWDIHRGDILLLNCSLNTPPSHCKHSTVATRNLGSKWPIFTGFNVDSIQFSNVTQVKVVSRNSATPIYYADKGFVNKSSLVDYINSIKLSRLVTHRKVLIIRSVDETQIILHQDGLNIVSYHLRVGSVV